MEGIIIKRYRAQKGDICRWPYQKVEYAQEYDGQQWSKPTPLQDLASADPARYARVIRPTEEPEHYDIVHRKKDIGRRFIEKKHRNRLSLGFVWILLSPLHKMSQGFFRMPIS